MLRLASSGSAAARRGWLVRALGPAPTLRLASASAAAPGLRRGVLALGPAPTLRLGAPRLLARSRCSGAAAPAEDEPPAAEPPLIYEGAKNKIVATIKKVSIANLGFAIASTPLLYVATNAMGSPGKGIAMSSLLLFFGGGTTGMLTWCTGTYVLRIRGAPGRDDAVTITTPTFFGGEADHDVAVGDITRPAGYHPFATFQAGGQKFYLDELGDMHDESFPAKLEAALNA